MDPREPEKGEGFPGQRIVVLPRTVVASALERPLLRSLLPTDVGYFPKASGHRRERPAGAEQSILIYCVRGRGWCELAGARHSVGPEDVLLIPARRAHAYGADPEAPWTIHWFHAVGTAVPAYGAELGLTPDRPVTHVPGEVALLALFEEVLDAVEHGYTPTQLLYASQTLAHLLGRMIWLRNQCPRGAPDAGQQVAQSIEFMKQHLARSLRVSQLAALAGLSSARYSELFRQRTGYSPIEYFIRLRMHRACQLLDTTGFSVKEIAAQLGYDDPFYFSRLFKQVNEVAPTDYRQLRKG
jgi:AraC-like DNA-binding protein